VFGPVEIFLDRRDSLGMINVTEKSVEQQDFTNIYLEIFLWMKIR